MFLNISFNEAAIGGAGTQLAEAKRGQNPLVIVKIM
jgi:hypothetical protein